MLGYYILWHYTRAWRDMARVVGNYLWFVANFFSLELLAKTLLSPWKRLSVSGGRGGEESVVGALIINTLMRFVGFGIRSVTIVAGVCTLFLTIAAAAAIAILWLLLPVIVFILFFAGLGSVIGVLQ